MKDANAIIGDSPNGKEFKTLKNKMEFLATSKLVAKK